MALNEEVSVRVGDIFEQYLKELAISEFPRGNGTWRNHLKWDSDLLESRNDICAELFTIERLLELSYQKPFHKEIEWSPDAKFILKEAIKYPHKTTLDNIHRKFKSLRILNRNIRYVDEYISKFENLEELVLSANKIKVLNTKLLPRNLLILELCGNELYNNVGRLCNTPPAQLQHIGLSHNRITTISNLIQPAPNCCWQALLSLDLSFNNIENLFQTVDILRILPKLRNLHLIGNPLYFFIGYRGYVIDSIKSLSFLDEVNISAHERHLFKGVSRIRNLPSANFCVIKLELDYLKGKIKCEPIENDEEVPRTYVKYHIELSFTKDCTIIDADDLDSSMDTILIIPESNEIIAASSHNKVIGSNGFNFVDDEFDFKFNKYIICNDIKQFTQLLSNEIEIRFIQTTVTMSNELIANAISPIPIIKEAPSADKSGKKLASKAPKRRDSNKSDPNISLTKRTGTTKPIKPKKTKVNFEDFRELTRTSEVYSSVNMDCRCILDGSFIFEKECLFLPLHVPETEPESEPEIANTIQLDRTKKKTGKFPSKQQETANSMKSSINGTKTNKIESITEELEGESDQENFQETIEPPLIQFKIEVIHWNTAKEGFDWTQKFGSRVL